MKEIRSQGKKRLMIFSLRGRRKMNREPARGLETDVLMAAQTTHPYQDSTLCMTIFNIWSIKSYDIGSVQHMLVRAFSHLNFYPCIWLAPDIHHQLQ